MPTTDERYLGLVSKALEVADDITEALNGCRSDERGLVLAMAVQMVQTQAAASAIADLGATCASSPAPSSPAKPSPAKLQIVKPQS